MSLFSSPSPLPKTVHLSKRAYDTLLGRPLLTPPTGYGYDEMACGLIPDWSNPSTNIQWIGEYGLERWREGTLAVLPNCPVCSVAWDETLESYVPRNEAST